MAKGAAGAAAPFGRDESGRALPPAAGDKVALGFDGSVREDSTFIVGTHLETGWQWVVGKWEKPQGPASDDWGGPRLKAYANAIIAGEVTHAGDAALTRHMGNAIKNTMNFVDDDGSPLYLIQKDRPGSPNKIDGAMAGDLSWTARTGAGGTGAPERPGGHGIY